MSDWNKNTKFKIADFFFFFSPDCLPLDFSIWARYAAAVGDTKPKNRADLVQRLEQRWEDVLNPEYITKCCSAAWDTLRGGQGVLLEARGHHQEGRERVRPRVEQLNIVDDSLVLHFMLFLVQ